jgi:hypothetical protein
MEKDPKAEACKGKPQLQLIPPVSLIECSKALLCGANKYGQYNWRFSEGVKVMDYLGAIKRHTDQFLEGQDLDDESLASHLGHIMATCAIILDAQSQGQMIDDRPRSVKNDQRNNKIAHWLSDGGTATI